MTEVSLAQSIFGGSTTEDNSNNKKNKKASSSSLSNLFDSSSALPEKPERLDFTATRKRKKREKKHKKDESDENLKGTDDEQINAKNDDDTTKKRIKKNRKQNEDDDTTQTQKGDSTASESKDEKGKNRYGKKDENEELTVFVGNLPKDITRRELAAIFRPCGKVVSSRIRSLATAGVKVAPEHAGNQNLVKKVCANTNQMIEDNPKKTSQGYVVFETKEALLAALKLNNTILPADDDDEGNNDTADQLRLRVDTAKPTVDSQRSVFVGNLKYAADESTLRDHFMTRCGWTNTTTTTEGGEEDGNVVEGVRIIRDPSTMQCKGFGYVLLKDKSYVPDALKLHDSSYMNRNIRVTVCGKRFKGRRGEGKDGGASSSSLSGADLRLKRKETKGGGGGGGVGVGKIDLKNKKKRGKKQIAHKANKGGLSKRAASGKKEEKRAKKIQKRITKGMGKTKKG